MICLFLSRNADTHLRPSFRDILTSLLLKGVDSATSSFGMEGSAKETNDIEDYYNTRHTYLKLSVFRH